MTIISQEDSARSRSQQIKGVLKAGTKLGFNVVLESVKQGGFEHYLRQQTINQSKKVGSYVAVSIADRIRGKLCGKAANNNSISDEILKQHVWE